MRKFIIAAALVPTFIAILLAPVLADGAPPLCKYQRSGVSFVPQTHWLDDRTETVLKAAADAACGRECVGIAGSCQRACVGPKYDTLVCELAVATPLVRQRYIDSWTDHFRPDLRTERQKEASRRYQEEQRQMERMMREVDERDAELERQRMARKQRSEECELRLRRMRDAHDKAVTALNERVIIAVKAARARVPNKEKLDAERNAYRSFEPARERLKAQASRVNNQMQNCGRIEKGWRLLDLDTGRIISE